MQTGATTRVAPPAAMWEQSSQRKHKQHRLVTHLAQFRREDEPALGNLAQSRHDGDVLPAAGLECHWRRIEAASDIDFPKWFKAHVIVGDERPVAEACEHEAARCGKRCAEVRIGRTHPVLDLASKWISGDDLGLGPREKPDPAAQQGPGESPEPV